MFSMMREYAEAGAVAGGPAGRSVREAGRVRFGNARQRVRGPWPARPAIVHAVPLRLVTEPVRSCARPRDIQGLQEWPAAGVAAGAGARLRRVAAGAAVFVVAAAVVVGLGVLAGLTTQAREHVPAVVSITVSEPATVWDVARRFAPAAEGPELSAVAERIVTTNSLTSVHVHPGQVLRVPLH